MTTIIKPMDYQVIQRSGNTGTVYFAGTADCPGGALLEVRVCTWDGGIPVTGWSEATLANGHWQTSLTLPQGGWYYLETRIRSGQGDILETLADRKRFGVGINILCMGQSNMVGQGEPPYTPADDRAACFREGKWRHLEDPYAGEGGSMVPALANSLIAELGIPVGFLPAADTGSGLHAANIGFAENRYWMYNAPEDESTLYGRALSLAKAAGGVELTVWNQGETDGRLLVPQDVYTQDMRILLRRLREDLGNRALPMFLCQIGTHDTNISNDRDYTAIRNAQAALDDGENFFLAATEMEFDRKDTAHYTTPALDEIGRRVANGILYYYGLRPCYRGPVILAARWTGAAHAEVDVHVRHRGGQDISTRGDISGFSLLSGDTEVSIRHARRLDNCTIRVTLASPPPDPCILRYLYGLNPPHSNIAKDDSPLRLPLEATTADIPILPAAE